MRIAVITGASSGIGREYAGLLAKESSVDEIWALARDIEKLKALADGSDFPIRTFSVDVSDPDSVKNFASALEKEKPGVTWLVNSAGFGKFCSYNDISPETSAAMVKTNCEGVVNITLAALPFMDGGAHIINMGSAAAFQPLPYENIYAATKAFVRSYSRALNRELAGRAISVTCACPSWVETDFFKTANSFETAKGATDYKGIVSPAVVAQKALDDAKKGRDMSVVTLRTKFEHLLAKILPQRMVMDTWMKRQKLN